MPFTYREIRDLYDQERDLGQIEDTLPEWSRKMNIATGSRDFDKGEKAGWWTRASTAADIGFFEPVAEVTTAPVGEAIGGLFGEKGAETGRQVGMGLPRAIVQTLPAILAAPLTGGGSLAAGAGALATGGLFGAQTYAETGSAKRALITGTVQTALPYAGKFGGGAALKAFGPEVEQVGAELYPKLTSDLFRFKAARFAGSQAAQISALQAGEFATSRVTGEPYDPLSADFWRQQIPWTVWDIAHTSIAKQPTAEVARAKVGEVVKAKLEVRAPQPYIPPSPTEEQRATLETTLSQLVAVYSDPKSTQSEKESAFAMADVLVKDPAKILQYKGPPLSPTVTITGWGHMNDNGNMKLLVRDKPEGVDLPGHNNLWVNDNADLTFKDNPDGTITVTTPLKYVNPRVTSPMTHKDFGVTPGTQDLPTQRKVKGKLNPAERRTLETRGIVPAPETEAALEPVSQQIEESQTKLATAKDNIEIVPTAATEIPSLVDVNKTGSMIQQDLTLGATPTEAVEKARLSTQTSLVDQYMQEQAGLAKLAKEVVKPEYKGREVLSWGQSLVDPKTGQRYYFPSSSEAQRFLDTYQRDNPHDVTDWEVTSHKKGKERRWFIGNRPGKKALLEAAPGIEEGENFVNLLENDPTGVVAARGQEYADNLSQNVAESSAEPIAVENRPQVSFDDMLSQLDFALKNVRWFSNESGLDVPDSFLAIRQSRVLIPLLREGKKSLSEVNTALEAQGVKGFSTYQDMTDTLRNVRAGLVGLSRQRDFAFGFFPPHDEDFVKEIGLHQPVGAVHSALTWFGKQGTDPIHLLVSDLANALPELGIHRANVSYVQKEGWAYFRDSNRINIPYLPTRAGAEDWMLKLAHEAAHFSLRDIFVRNDPAAVKFKATLSQVHDSLMASQLIPKKVKDAISLARKGGWYDDYRRTGDQKKLLDAFDNAAGKENRDWFGVFYGLQSHEEMLAEVFGSRKMSELMNQTRMLRTPLQTVLNFFARAYSTFIKGRPLTDTAMERVLTSFDDYLSGPDVRRPRIDVQSPEFRSWFKGSKVVDERGNPLVVYHGSLSHFEDFDITKLGSVTGAPSAKLGFFFARNPEVATGYGSEAISRVLRLRRMVTALENKLKARGIDPETAMGWGPKTAGAKTPKDLLDTQRYITLAEAFDEATWGDNPASAVDLARRGNRYDVYLNLKNPLTVDFGGHAYRPESYFDLLTRAKNEGHDGVIIKNTQDRATADAEGQTDIYVAFDTKQIRTNTVRRGDDRSFNYNGRDFIRDSVVAVGSRPEAVGSRISDIEKFYSTGDLSHLINGFQSESQRGHLPVTTEKGAVHPEVLKALTTGEIKDVTARTLGLLEPDVQFHKDLWLRMHDDVTIAKNLYEAIKKGQIVGELPPDIASKIKLAQVKLNAMNNALGRQAAAISRYSDLSNFTMAGLERTIWQRLVSDKLPGPPDPTSLAREAQEALGLHDEPSERTKVSREELERAGPLQRFGSWVVRTMISTQYAKELIPGVRPAIDHTYLEWRDSNLRENESNLARFTNPTTGEIDKGLMKFYSTLFRDRGSSRLTRTLSNIHLYFQTEEAAGRRPTMQDKAVVRELRSLDASTRTNVLAYFDSTLRTNRHYVEKTVGNDFLPKLNMLTSAYVITAHETGMKPEVGAMLASKLIDGLNMLPQNPQAGTDMLRTVAAGMKPETFAIAMNTTRNLLAASQKHLDFMRTRTRYVTEQRLDGQHAIRMTTPSGRPFFYKYPTKARALEAVKKLEEGGYKFLEYVGPESADVTGGIEEKTLASMMELDQQHANQLETAFKDRPELLEALLPHTQRATEYLASKAAFTAVPGAGFPRRRFVAGREEINMVQNEYIGYKRFSNWMFHQLMRAQSRLDLLDPELLANRESSKYVQQHVENMLTRDNPIAQSLAEFAYNWKLAFNFGVNFLHGIQAYTTGMTSLISETGGVQDAFKYTVRAQKELVSYLTNKFKWGTPDLEWLDKQAGLQGLRGAISWDGDIAAADRDLMIDANTAPWAKPVEFIKHQARNWNGAFFKYNDRVGLISSFLLGKDRGMTNEQALTFAVDAKNRGFFTAGKPGRPVGQWNVKTRSIPQLMSSLQSYVQGWFSMLAYNYVRGFRDMPADMSAAQRAGARKAFLYQMGAQAVLAGALGLPGVGQGMALVKQFTGVDTMAYLRRHLADFFGEDQDSGGFMTSLALHGAVAAFTPVDPSGRHLPSIPYIGVSPYKGFDVAQLFGAPISSAADLVRGIVSAARGDPKGAEALLPPFLTGPLELWRGEGDVRDPKGVLITHMTPMEQFVTALGMKPSRVQALKDVNAAAKDVQSRASKEKTDAVRKIATKYRSDPRTARRDFIQFLQDNPDEDAVNISRSIAGHVADQTIPYDWRRHVNVAAEGLGSRQPSSEVARRDLIYSVQQDLGVPRRLNVRADRDAEDIDELLDGNPNMTRAEALKQIRRPRHRRFSITDGQ